LEYSSIVKSKFTQQRPDFIAQRLACERKLDKYIVDVDGIEDTERAVVILQTEVDEKKRAKPYYELMYSQVEQDFLRIVKEKEKNTREPVPTLFNTVVNNRSPSSALQPHRRDSQEAKSRMHEQPNSQPRRDSNIQHYVESAII
jgi:hypothetical protein